MADGADFAQHVGDGEELGRAGEELALEIGAEAEGHHRDVEPVGDAGELPDLVVGEELGLVDEDAIDARGGVLGADAILKRSSVVGEELGFGLDAEARADHADAVLGIERRGEQQRAHAALAVVVGGLEQQGGFAGVHRGVGEVELCHGPNGHRRAGEARATGRRGHKKSGCRSSREPGFGVNPAGTAEGEQPLIPLNQLGARFANGNRGRA